LSERRNESIRLRKEVRKQTATAIAAAFSFIIALFWRDAITDIINKLLEKFGLTGSTYLAKQSPRGCISSVCERATRPNYLFYSNVYKINFSGDSPISASSGCCSYAPSLIAGFY